MYRGAKVSTTNSENFSPLAAAAQSRDLRSLRVLLEYADDEDLCIRSRNGFSPIIWALVGSLDIDCSRSTDNDKKDASTSSISGLSEGSTVHAHHFQHDYNISPRRIKDSQLTACANELLSFISTASCNMKSKKVLFNEMLEGSYLSPLSLSI